MKYLAIGNNAKTLKSDKRGEYLTAILYLAPADTVAGINVCPMAERAGCREVCLYTAGRGAFNNVQRARVKKTEAFRDDPTAFVDQLKVDITEALKKAYKVAVKLAVRLNGTSDIAWENLKGSDGRTIMETFPTVQFYDYTKLPNRKVPSNYHLTVSYSAANEAYAIKAIQSVRNVAVVFRSRDIIPATFAGRAVIDGDATDLRFTDRAGVIVGLYAKGQARHDRTGFVIG